MKHWVVIALLVLALLVIYKTREHYTDPESPVTRPTRNSIWLSKIDSEAPLGGNDDDYIRVIQAFYDKVYTPAETKPKDIDIELFLRSSDANVPGVDPNAIRKIIAAGFHTEFTTTAAEREEKEVAFKPSDAIQPSDGVDEVYVRKEAIYTPADNTIGNLPEGIYAPIPQQDMPRRSGEYDDNSTSWKGGQFSKI